MHQYTSLTCPHAPTIQGSGGDYLIINSGSDQDRFVRKVQQVNAAQSILQVQIFLLAAKIANHQVHVPQLNISTYSFVSGMVEIVETNRIKWVNISTIGDYAFIFHEDSIQLGMHFTSDFRCFKEG